MTRQDEAMFFVCSGLWLLMAATLVVGWAAYACGRPGLALVITGAAVAFAVAALAAGVARSTGRVLMAVRAAKGAYRR